VIRNGFLPVGQITEVPVQLTGVVRFRPESPFDPYVGGGVGYIFTSLDTSDSNIGTPVTISASTVAGDNRVVTMRNFDDVSAYTNGLMVTSIRSGARGTESYPCHRISYTPDLCEAVVPQGGIPITALEASVNSAPEFHLMGGVDYYFTSHLSMYIDGRYLWAQSKVEVRINGEKQIAAGIKDYGCQSFGASCRLDNNTIKDTSQSRIINDTIDDVSDVILIQGGDIRLGGFSLGVGFKYTF
jgi:opacity protein-like surface antigen